MIISKRHTWTDILIHPKTIRDRLILTLVITLVAGIVARFVLQESISQTLSAVASVGFGGLTMIPIMSYMRKQGPPDKQSH